jgi:hypothetical protein
MPTKETAIEAATYFYQLADRAPNVAEAEEVRAYFNVFAEAVRKAKRGKADIPPEIRTLYEVESIADAVCLEEARAAWNVAAAGKADVSRLPAKKRRALQNIVTLCREGWTEERFLKKFSRRRQRVWEFVQRLFDERVEANSWEETADAMGNYARRGYAYVTDYYKRASPTTRDALQNRLRTRLIKAGAVCVSANKYVDVAKADQHELSRALGTRIESISADIKSARKLLQALPSEQQGEWLAVAPFLAEVADHAQA